MKDACATHLSAAGQALADAVTYRVVVKTGDPLSELITLVNASDCQLVVAGRHRRRNFLSEMFKPTIEKLVEHADKPFLIAREPTDAPYDVAIAATALSPACAAAAKMAWTIAPKAKLEILHAWLAPFEGIAGDENSAHAKIVKVETGLKAREWMVALPDGLPDVTLVHGSITRHAVEKARRSPYALLAVGAHTRSLKMFGLGTFARGLLRDPPSDLLITR